MSRAWPLICRYSTNQDRTAISPILLKDQTEGQYKSTKKHQKYTSANQLEKLQQSKKVVQVAIMSNTIIFASKSYGFVTSNSATMFAESMHSLADIFNQFLLMMGLIRSLRVPDYSHPYGYEGEKYAWAMLSGVGVFFLGGGVTLYHGVVGLFNPSELQDITPALLALGGCAVFDLASFSFAFTNIRKQAVEAKMGFIPYLLNSADPSSVQVMMEDSAALTGVALASTFIILSKYLNMPIFDAIGSISIGVLLSFVGVFLIRRNMHNLLGKRMDIKFEQQIIDLIISQPTVKSVHHVKTTSIGPDWSRFKGTFVFNAAEILFDGKAIAQKLFETNPHKHKQNVEYLKTLKTEEEIENWMCNNGDEILGIVGKEIDSLELKIQEIRPEVKHIDLEIL